MVSLQQGKCSTISRLTLAIRANQRFDPPNGLVIDRFHCVAEIADTEQVADLRRNSGASRLDPSKDAELSPASPVEIPSSDAVSR
jgi:hypothetical protein